MKMDSHTRFQVCRLADAGDSLCFNPHATCGFLGSIRVTNKASRVLGAEDAHPRHHLTLSRLASIRGWSP